MTHLVWNAEISLIHIHPPRCWGSVELLGGPVFPELVKCQPNGRESPIYENRETAPSQYAIYIHFRMFAT